MTSRIKQPSLYRWPSGECISIGGLSIRLNEIAERHELTVENYTEDGLGRMSAIGCEFPSGLVVLLEESEYAIECLNAKGPALFADLKLSVTRGMESIRLEVLHELGLGPDDVDWLREQNSELQSLEDYRRRNGRDP